MRWRLIALAIAEVLDQAGFDGPGPAGSVGQAVVLHDGAHCDAAVLDMNLGGEMAEPIAQWLAGMEVPFVATSGYNPSQIPAVFVSAPLFAKPLDFTALVDGIKACLPA